MKKIALASAMVLVMGGCAPKSNKQLLSQYILIQDSCEAEHTNKATIEKIETPEDLEAVVDSTEKCAKDDIFVLAKGRHINGTEEKFLLGLNEYNYSLKKRFYRGEIEERRVAPMLKTWLQVNAPSQFNFWEFAARYNAYAATPQGAYNDAIIRGADYDEAQKAYNGAIMGQAVQSGDYGLYNSMRQQEQLDEIQKNINGMKDCQQYGLCMY